MSFETPYRADLSQDNLGNQELWDSLTPEEQIKLQEYLNTEHERIIYLTQTELSELRSIIGEDEDISAQHDADFDEFMETQVQEGFSLSDIIGELGEGEVSFPPEALDQLETQSIELLFGENGIFSGLEISEQAQDLMASAFVLAAIENAINSPESLVQLAESLRTGGTRENILGLFQGYEDAFENIRLALQTPTALDIAENGERNIIFMDTISGKEFFQQALAGAGSQELRDALQEANRQEDIPPMTPERIQQIRDTGIISATEIEAARGAIEEALERSRGSGLPEDTGQQGEQTSLERLRSMGILGQFLATLLETFQGIFPNLVTEESPQGGEEDRTQRETSPENAPQSPAQRAREFFIQNANSAVFSGITRESIIALFPESGEIPPAVQRILETIQRLPGDQSLEEKMRDIFLQEVPVEDGSPERIPKLLRFISEMEQGVNISISLSNPDGTLSQENLLTVLTSYTNYRILNTEWRSENEGEGRSMTYREFFEGEGREEVE